jgi:hypothetical protein
MTEKIQKILPYAKAVAAAVGAVVLFLEVAADGSITLEEWGFVATSVGTVFAVFQVKNKKV